MKEYEDPYFDSLSKPLICDGTSRCLSNPLGCDWEDCPELHNDLPSGELHHYGCECSDCLLFYWKLKN